MSFNKKLTEDRGKSNETKKFLSYFAYKTRNIKDFDSIASRLDIVSKLNEQKLPIAEHEKISLSDYGIISDISSIQNKDSYNRILKNIAITGNKKFEEIYSKIQTSSEMIKDLDKKILKTNDYKSGDLMMYLAEKSFVIRGVQNLSGFKTGIKEMLITKYSHAAPIYIDSSDPANPTVNKSDIWKEQRSEELSLGEILRSNTFRIDPTKLVDQKRIKQLEQINYGYKKDKDGKDLLDNNGKPIKETWQDVMKFRYEKLSEALHLGQIPQQINELEKNIKKSIGKIEDQIKFNDVYQNSNSLIEYGEKLKNMLTKNKNEYTSLYSGLKDKLGEDILKKILEKNIILPDEYPNHQKDINELIKKDKYCKEIETKITLLESSEVKKLSRMQEDIRIKKRNFIKNDKNRLGAEHWLMPQNFIDGHTMRFSSNDLRVLSVQMFNANTKERQMICSEFAAKSTISTLDQLNKMTSFDLMAENLIDKETKIVKDVIPENENLKNIHPERLVKLLKDSGAVEKIENSYLKNLIRLDDTSKSEQSIDNTKALPKSIYSILINSGNSDDFKKNATGVMEVYLKTLKVGDDTINQVKEHISDKQLDDIYNQYTKKPDGIFENICQFCTKALEFCKILTKDKGIKQNLDNMIKDVFNGDVKAKNKIQDNQNNLPPIVPQLANQQNKQQRYP